MTALYELILNPLAGPAGVNLTSIGFYLSIAAVGVAAIMER